MTNGAKHSRLMVLLHWLVALAILNSMIGGWVIIRGADAIDPRMIGVMMLHMAVGSAIGALTIARMIARRRGKRADLPGEMESATGRFAARMHAASYWLVLAMVATGFAIAISTGLKDVVFGGTAAAIPAEMARAVDESPARAVHAALAWALFAFLGLHLAGLIRSQTRGERPFRRMLP